MAVTAVETSTTPVVGAPARDASQMTDLDFMNLLVAQIRNQDPLSPMSNAEFTSQITQFSMLEQIAALGSKMDEQVLMSQAINNTAMLSLIGRDVTVAGDEVVVGDEGVSRSQLNCAGAGQATVEVCDETGAVVATYTRAVTPGLNDVSWDGLLASGDKAGDGRYSLRVKVADAAGTAVAAQVLMTGRVEGLRFDSNVAVVTVRGEEYCVADIYRIS